jgi:hypothetical protein
VGKPPTLTESMTFGDGFENNRLDSSSFSAFFRQKNPEGNNWPFV